MRQDVASMTESHGASLPVAALSKERKALEAGKLFVKIREV
jgi:hypothetical protein